MNDNLTTGSSTRQDSISSMVQVALKKNAVVASAFRDVSMFAEQGSGSISFPYRGNKFNVQKLSGSQKGQAQELVLALDKMDLSEEAHIQWVIKKFDQARAKVNLLREALSDATSEHAIQLDQDILDELIPNIDAGNIQTGGVTQDNVVNLAVKLNVARVPRADRTWIFGNDSYGALLKIDGFVDASKSNLDIVRAGMIGELYGVPVIESDVMVTGEALLVHRDSLAYGFGEMPEVEDEKAIEYGTGARRWVMDALYGMKHLQGGKLAGRLTA